MFLHSLLMKKKKTKTDINPGTRKAWRTIYESKHLAMQAVELSGVDYSNLGGKPSPKPSARLCFYQTVKATAKRNLQKDKVNIYPFFRIYLCMRIFFNFGTHVRIR